MMKKLILSAFVAVMGLFAYAQAPGRPGLLNRRQPIGRPGAPTNNQPAMAPNKAKTVESGGRSIEFTASPVEMVFKVYGELVDKTVLKDPGVPAVTITLQPKQGQELTDADKILAIETVLEMNGIHLEPYGEKFVRALPRGTARKEGIPLLMDPESPLGETERVVSVMMSFQHIALEEAQKALEGLKSDKGVLNVFERSNTILVTDTEMNINRMREVIRAIDLQTPVLENVFVRQIENASAMDIQKVLQEIVEDAKKILEKQGKQSNNTPHPTQTPTRLLGGRNNQPAQPSSNASIVTGVSDADRGMIRGDSLIIADERSNKLIIKTQKSNMDFFDKVIEQLDVETTPDTVVKVYRLKYADSEDVSDMINDLIGNAPSGKNSKGNQNASAKQSGGSRGANVTSGTTSGPKKSSNQRTGEAKAGELSKENTTVLSDKRINGIVVMTQKELVPVVESIIEAMDVKLSQVLIETCIIEVTLGDGIKTGVDWVRNGRYSDGTAVKTGDHGLPMYYYSDGNGNVKELEYSGTDSVTIDDTTWTKFGSALTKTVVTKGKEASYFTGNAGYASLLGGGANNGGAAANLLTAAASNTFGSAFNYIFKSDKLNMSAVIQASKTDSRTKYLASPIVMTVDNKEATIEATESRKFFSGYETSSSYSTYMRTPKYDSKDIGIKIKVTPKINPNGTVMLEIEEEYSQVIEGGQSILVGDGAGTEPIDTSLQRKMSADALLENAQTVILCGLTETYKSETESGIPILKDIPWIGKWLFGSVSQNENRKELLIFMTPYVMNDPEDAEKEAARRKKALSDTRSWDDHGWSKSKLADPVSKKEQLRRLKDEWKKQDEEHATEREIDKAKIRRVIDLKRRDLDEDKVKKEEIMEALDELNALDAEKAQSDAEAGKSDTEAELKASVTNALTNVTVQ